MNQQTPWISLSLLLVGYAIQGYLLTQQRQHLMIYLVIITGYVLLQLMLLHAGAQQVRNTLRRWISSDAIHVIGILMVTFLASFILSYLKIFEDLLLVLAVEILVRLDLQQAGLNPGQKVMILTLCLTFGLTTGWLAHELVA